jgi:hypothetical protein
MHPAPIQLDVHPITCSLGRPTRHFDVRFAAIAAAGAEPVMSAESDDLRWWPVGALPRDVDPLLAGSVALAVAAFEAGPGACASRRSPPQRIEPGHPAPHPGSTEDTVVQSL